MTEVVNADFLEINPQDYGLVFLGLWVSFLRIMG